MRSAWRVLDELAPPAEHEPDDEGGTLLSLEQAAARLGVPAVQLARWCADGSIAPRAFVGSPLGRIQFAPSWLAKLERAIQGGAINAPEPW